MGFRMYCDSWPEGFADSTKGDNESPKFYGYTDTGYIPTSYTILQTMAEKGLLRCSTPTDHYCLDDYQNMCIVGATEVYILEDKYFKTFIDAFIKDLIDNGYGIRESYLKYVNELKNLPGDKCIWWC